jgi:hypothetical protein
MGFSHINNGHELNGIIGRIVNGKHEIYDRQGLNRFKGGDL